MESDRLGNKQTWVARHGRGFGFTLVGTCLPAAHRVFLHLSVAIHTEGSAGSSHPGPSVFAAFERRNGVVDQETSLGGASH